MSVKCACGKDINFSTGQLPSVETYKYNDYGDKVLIYAVCSHGTVIVDNRKTVFPEIEKAIHFEPAKDYTAI